MNTTRRLCAFLSACGGNWRNTIFIRCPGVPGYLMAMDRDGQPVILAVERFCEAAGVQVDPGECRGHLDQAAFQDIYAQYLLWRLPAAGGNPLADLTQT